MNTKKADIKRNNIISILDIIRQPGTHSRREIQKITGLSWGAVSTITSLLLEQNLIIETGEADTAFGRKPSEIDINPHIHYVIGIDLNILGLTVVVSDIKGGIKSEITRLLPHADRDYILDELLKILDIDVFEKFRDRQLIAIGIAAQGLVDTQAGISVFSPYFKNWKNVEICKLIEERYALPAYIFHDPDCVLLTERLLSGYSSKNPVLIRMNNGIGMSAVVNGEPFSTAEGHSPELGHVTAEADGPLCGCGKKGCFEAFISNTGIVQRFFEQVNQGWETAINLSNPGTITYQTIYEAAKSGDALSMQIYKTTGFYIGMAIACVINMYGPDEIILYGNIPKMHDIYEEEMQRTIESNVFYAQRIPPIRFSVLDKNAAALGGGLSAFSKHIKNNTDFFHKTGMLKEGYG